MFIRSVVTQKNLFYEVWHKVLRLFISHAWKNKKSVQIPQAYLR